MCALIDAMDFRGQQIPVMNEVFATIDDARIVLGHQLEIDDDTDTADSKPRTVDCATNRLARMVGLDHRSFLHDDAVHASKQIHAAARKRISAKIPQVAHGQVVISGHCDDLVEMGDGSVVHLSGILGPAVSRSAPAYAVARLAQASVK